MRLDKMKVVMVMRSFLQTVSWKKVGVFSTVFAIVASLTLALVLREPPKNSRVVKPEAGQSLARRAPLALMSTAGSPGQLVPTPPQDGGPFILQANSGVMSWPPAPPDGGSGGGGGAEVYTCLGSTSTTVFGAASGSGKVACCSDEPLCYIDQPIADVWEQLSVSTPVGVYAPAAVANWTAIGVGMQQVGDSIISTSPWSWSTGAWRAIPGGITTPYKVVVAGSLEGTPQTTNIYFGASLSCGGVGNGGATICNSGAQTFPTPIGNNNNGSGFYFYAREYASSSVITQKFGRATLGGGNNVTAYYDQTGDYSSAWGQSYVWTRLVNDGTYLYAQHSSHGNFWSTGNSQTLTGISNNVSNILYYGWICGDPDNFAAAPSCFVSEAYIQNITTLSISTISCSGTVATVTITGSLDTVGIQSGTQVGFKGISVLSGTFPVQVGTCGDQTGTSTCAGTNVNSSDGTPAAITRTGTTTFTFPWGACTASGGSVYNLSL